MDYGGASHDNKTTALTVLEKHYSNYKYLSLDIAPNKENEYESTRKNVDIVVKDPYKITELEKQLEIKTKQLERSQAKIIKDLPKDIRKVIGHIEFARPLDNK